jgi:protein involved in polysaccharide export with SLBB domain
MKLHHVLITIFLIATSCSVMNKKSPQPKKTDFTIKPVPAIVGSGDMLKVSSFDEKLPGGIFVVSKDGFILFPYIGKVKVGGKRLEEVTEIIIRKLKDGYFRNPMLTIVYKSRMSQQITMFGSVKKPQTISYRPKITLLDALSKSGGFAPNADKEYITIMRTYKGRKYRIKVSITDIIEGKIPNFYLLPGDVVIVPSKMI